MNLPSNSQQSSQNGPWWRSTRDGLGDRIAAIQRINDPTTNADEVLKGAKILLTFLLIFTGILGGLSYFRNFSISLDPRIAAVFAIILTAVIEWGKNKCVTWAVRMPFFQGWGYIFKSVASTFIFMGLLLVGIVTFTMSVYNSTRGGEQLALMLSHEKNHSPFQPNTAEIDKQIASTQGTITAAPLVKWKGKQYYQDAKSVRLAQNSVESLQRQREITIQQQRTDWESDNALKQENSSFAASIVLASGGWVELLQVLLILLRVACEKNLDGRQSSPTPQRNQVAGQSIGFNNHKTSTIQNALPESRRIGFREVDDQGNIVPATSRHIAQDTVMQTATMQPKPQSYVIDANRYVIDAAPDFNTVGADNILKSLKQKIQAEIPNLTARHTNPSTVSTRIKKHFDETGMLMHQRGFTPSRNVAIDVWNYLSVTAFPSLIERGWPYERQQTFLSKLLAFTEAKGGQGA